MSTQLKLNKLILPTLNYAWLSGLVIEVTDIANNTTISYDSISEAVRALNIPSHKVIVNYIKNNQQKPYKGIYIFKKVD